MKPGDPLTKTGARTAEARYTKLPTSTAKQEMEKCADLPPPPPELLQDATPNRYETMPLPQRPRNETEQPGNARKHLPGENGNNNKVMTHGSRTMPSKSSAHRQQVTSPGARSNRDSAEFPPPPPEALQSCAGQQHATVRKPRLLSELPDDVIRYKIVETPPPTKRQVRSCAGGQTPQCEYGYHLKTGKKFRIYNAKEAQQPLTLQHKNQSPRRLLSTSAAQDVTSPDSRDAGANNTGTL